MIKHISDAAEKMNCAFRKCANSIVDRISGESCDSGYLALAHVDRYMRDRCKGSVFERLEAKSFRSSDKNSMIYYKCKIDGVFGSAVECWLFQIDEHGNIRSALKSED